EPVYLRRELDPVTDTALLLRRLGRVHARARAGAVLLTSAGVALAIAGAGLSLAPEVAPIVAAWVLIGGIVVVAAALASRAGRRGLGPPWSSPRHRRRGARPRSGIRCAPSPTPARRCGSSWTARRCAGATASAWWSRCRRRRGPSSGRAAPASPGGRRR